MPLSMGEKIKIVLGRRNMTLGELADKTDQSRQNLSNKMKRDNFIFFNRKGCSNNVRSDEEER